VVFGGRAESLGCAIERELGGAARFVPHDVGSEESWKEIVRSRSISAARSMVS
jgi:hypothetical protein